MAKPEGKNYSGQINGFTGSSQRHKRFQDHQYMQTTNVNAQKAIAIDEALAKKIAEADGSLEY
jgi:hypothetical protein